MKYLTEDLCVILNTKFQSSEAAETEMQLDI